MDREEICKDVMGLWTMIEAEWMKSHSSVINRDVHISLFERAHSYIIHQNIGAEKQKQKEEHADPEDRDHCNQCGRAFTEKEMKFLDDQPSKPRICYHCTKGL